jgi:protein mago nashi
MRLVRLGAHDHFREDDVAWPKKNIVGRQELEVRIDKEHISFEVSSFVASCSSSRSS